jgi:hypothetical protein
VARVERNLHEYSAEPDEPREYEPSRRCDHGTWVEIRVEAVLRIHP